MYKEEYKLKLHKYRSLKRKLLQKAHIREWEFLESLKWDEDKSPKPTWEEYYEEKGKVMNILDNIYEKIDELKKKL